MKNPKCPKCPKCNSYKEVILLSSATSILGGIQPSTLGSVSGSLFFPIFSKKNKNKDTPHSQFKCNNCNECFRK